VQDQLGVAQAEYGQALAKLNGAKGALESLSSRVQSSEKAAKGELCCCALGRTLKERHGREGHRF
jgi:hypothetical protein